MSVSRNTCVAHEVEMSATADLEHHCLLLACDLTVRCYQHYTTAFIAEHCNTTVRC